MSTQLVVSLPKGNKKKKSEVTSAVNVTGAANKKKNKNKKNNKKKNKNKTSSAVNDYVSTLANPWESAPLRLGWGTLVATDLYTAYARFSLTTNSDGTFAIALVPTVGSTTAPIYYNTSGLAGVTWTTASFANAAAIASAASEGRVVSGGIKVYPLIPATVSPGILYTGSVPSINNTNLTSSSIATIVGYPEMRIGYGATGGSSVIHPVDVTSYAFSPYTITGYAGALLPNTSTPLIVGTNFAMNSTIYVEATINIETIIAANSSINSQAITNPEVRQQTNDTLSDYFPSIESMWKKISAYLPDAGQVYTGATVAGAAMASPMGRAVGNLLLNNARRRYFMPPQQNRMVIQEMD